MKRRKLEKYSQEEIDEIKRSRICRGNRSELIMPRENQLKDSNAINRIYEIIESHEDIQLLRCVNDTIKLSFKDKVFFYGIHNQRWRYDGEKLWRPSTGLICVLLEIDHNIISSMPLKAKCYEKIKIGLKSSSEILNLCSQNTFDLEDDIVVHLSSGESKKIRKSDIAFYTTQKLDHPLSP